MVSGGGGGSGGGMRGFLPQKSFPLQSVGYLYLCFCKDKDSNI